MHALTLLLLLLALALSAGGLAIAQADQGSKYPLMIAQGTQPSDQQSPPGGEQAQKEEKKEEKERISPEEKMRRRFPQPVRVGDLIGLPLLDEADSTIGRVRHVVRGSDGKIALVVSHGGLFGWGRRLVTVPIEVVAILGRQIAALDLPPQDFAKAPTWRGSGSDPIDRNETIRIALARR